MKPSDHLKRGECPFCCGMGEIESLIEGMHSCPLCSGTKKWPPPEEGWEKEFDEQQQPEQ